MANANPTSSGTPEIVTVRRVYRPDCEREARGFDILLGALAKRVKCAAQAAPPARQEPPGASEKKSA